MIGLMVLRRMFSLPFLEAGFSRLSSPDLLFDLVALSFDPFVRHCIEADLPLPSPLQPSHVEHDQHRTGVNFLLHRPRSELAVSSPPVPHQD